MMQGSPILYFSFDEVVADPVQMDEEKQNTIANAWARDAHGAPVRVGSLQVGKVAHVRVDEINRRVGFEIEWSDNIQVARKI